MRAIFNYVSKVWQTIRGTREGALLVETAHAGFFDVREFRMFFDFALTNGQTAVLKFVSPINFVLHSQAFAVDNGALLFEAAVGGSEGGTFSTTVPAFGKNRTNERLIPDYVKQVSVATGGTHTGGTVVEKVRLKTVNATGQQATVGAGEEDERALPPGTYYLRFTANGSDVAGIYYLIWEERP